MNKLNREKKAIAVVSKPLDIILSEEFFYQQSVKKEDILWVVIKNNGDKTKDSISFLNRNYPVSKLLTWSYFVFIRTHEFQVLKDSDKTVFRRLKMAVFGPVNAISWYFSAFLFWKKIKRFGDYSEVDFFLSSPDSRNILPSVFFKNAKLIIFDGGYSTVTWRLVEDTKDGGGRKLISRCLKSYGSPLKLTQVVL